MIKSRNLANARGYGFIFLATKFFSFGQQNDFALENLFTIIDEPYKSNKPLIITTNLTLDQIENPARIEHRRIYVIGFLKSVPRWLLMAAISAMKSG